MEHSERSRSIAPGLTGRQLAVVLLGLVGLFVFGFGPIWNRLWEPDVSILWSYAPIPFIVAGCQFWNRTWSASRWILASFIVACLKYGITAAIYVTLLMASGKPPARAPESHTSPVTETSPIVDPDPEPTAIDPKKTGTIRGIVRDPEGRPFAGALVQIRGGLEDFVFARDARPVLLEIRGWSYAPPILGIRVGQPLVTKCADGRTHTLNAFDEGKRYLFNAAILGEREIRFTHPRRHVELHCAIHSDERGYVGVFSHPFFVVTGADGMFTFAGVPAGSLVVGAWNPNFSDVERSVRVLAEDAPSDPALVELQF
jgi:hypothetical protein